MKLLGIDLGFKQVKMYHDKYMVKFPSVVGYPSAIELTSDIKDPVRNLVVVEGGKTYYLGEKALRDTRNAQLNFTVDKTNDFSDKVKYMACLGLSLHTKPEDQFTVVTGLPVDEFAGHAGLREAMKTNMEGNFQFIVNGKEKKADVTNVIVIPQSAGAYYDYIMDNDGKVDEKLVTPKTVIVDIGFRTTDVVTMCNARYSPSESFTLHTGVSDMHKELRRLLLQHYGIQKDIVEIDAIFRAVSIYIGAIEYDIAHLVQKAVQPYAEKILTTLPLYIPNMSEIHNLLLTGGGGNITAAAFTDGLPHIPQIHMKNAEFSNAKGYYKYAQFIKGASK